MRATRTGATALAMALAACGDSKGGGSDVSSGQASSDDSTAATTIGGSSSGAGSSEGGGTGAVDSTGGSDGSTGGGGQVQLVNDGWSDGAPAAFQMGFVMGECWASTFVADPAQYPFTVVGATMVVGGADMGTADFEIGLWEVDAGGMPTTSIGTGVATLSGADNGFDAVALEPLGIVPPLVEAGSFAISACLLAHDGFPGIARDDDGTIAEDRNWIYTAQGTWAAAADLGLGGDWIMRATIELQ
jgi:hypothetical protein